MSYSANSFHSWSYKYLLRSLTLLLSLSLSAVGSRMAYAQQDPTGCFQSGPSIILGVFFSNGTTGVGSATLSECETIVYRVTLTKAGGSNVCAFQGGTLTLTTPDGIVHNLTPGGGIPCLGGTGSNGSGCVSGQPPVVGTVTYMVRPQDIVSGNISALASYTGGTLFDKMPPTPGVSTSTPKSTPAQACSNGLVCDGIETCNANGTSGPRKGLCESGSPLVCTPNQCNTAACVEPTGCVLTPVANGTNCTDTDTNACTTAQCVGGTCSQTAQVTTCAADSNSCTDDPPCNPATGVCTHPNKVDGASCPDTDGTICTTAACSAGACSQTFATLTCTPDSNECTDDPACHPTNGCTHPARPNGTSCADTDSNLCTTAQCQGGACSQSAQVITCTPDANSCTDDPPCAPATGLCTHPTRPDGASCTDTDGTICTVASCQAGGCNQTASTLSCPADANECTDDPGCHPVNGCVHPAKSDGTACTDSDASLCTSAQCIAGACSQTAQVTVCQPDSSDCTDDPPCDPQVGVCSHPPRPDASACLDTDEDSCTIPACQTGACNQAYSIDLSNPVCLCGNQVLDPNETCDPPNPILLPNGTPTCNTHCTFCGDGVVNGGATLADPTHETCDDGDTNDGTIAPCRNNCTLPICGDPAKIKFRDAPRNDFFKVFGRIQPQLPFNPIGQTILFTLTNANGTVVQFQLAPGDLLPKGSGFGFGQKGVDKQPASGISAFKLRPHRLGYWTFTLKAFGDLSPAELPNAPAAMSGTLAIGTDEFTTDGIWIRTRTGWVLYLQNSIPVCG